MTSPNQTAIVEDHVNDALATGARALTGGKRVEGPGDYFEPTVLVDVDHSMKVMRDETFGPVVGVMKVRDAEEALRLANDTPLRPLGLGLRREGARRAGRPPGRVRRDQRQRRAGQLLRRRTCRWAAGRSPGIGFRHGEYGIKKFCRPESIVDHPLRRQARADLVPVHQGPPRPASAASPRRSTRGT